jgi:hypothetical protein
MELIKLEINPEQKVRIKRNNDYIDGTTLSSVTLRGKNYWWVQYSSYSGQQDCGLYDEDDLCEWMYEPEEEKEDKCTCGAWSVDSSMHSVWCDIKQKEA